MGVVLTVSTEGTECLANFLYYKTMQHPVFKLFRDYSLSTSPISKIWRYRTTEGFSVNNGFFGIRFTRTVVRILYTFLCIGTVFSDVYTSLYEPGSPVSIGHRPCFPRPCRSTLYRARLSLDRCISGFPPYAVVFKGDVLSHWLGPRTHTSDGLRPIGRWLSGSTFRWLNSPCEIARKR